MQSGGAVMNIASFLALPPTLTVDRVERSTQGLIVYLSATTSVVSCPRCGTVGSRIHSRYTRTVADLTCVGQRLTLKLLVRKWICPLDSCPQRIFAEPFAGLVRRYARMTDRLIKALQSMGVTTNGADGACLSSSLAMPTTAKTLIRRVLELPLPQEGSVRIAGIDEWAWKKGARYGTILVDLEHRRVAALLPERSVDSSTDWFKKHAEVKIVSRDRGKIFRAAVDAGAPQAKQVVDRFHLQKNFADALEKFFSHHKQILKKAAQHLAGKSPPPPKTTASRHIEQERRHRYAERVRRHKRIWKLFRAGYRKEEIAQMVGVGSRSVYRALEQEQPPTWHKRHWTHHVVDAYVPYLTKRWNEGCHTARQLYQEIVAQGYTGSLRTLEKIVVHLRPQRAKSATKQTITFQRVPSPRNAALMIVRPQTSRTADQTTFIDQLCKSAPTAAIVCSLASSFGSLLRKREGKPGLEQWKGAVRASGVPELINFVEGLADDAEAVANGCTESWSNGMTEGFVNKVKWIKRSSYGQAGFPLLQRRVLLHPKASESLNKDRRQHSCRRSAPPAHDNASGIKSVPVAIAAGSSA
jgi:transposase